MLVAGAFSGPIVGSLVDKTKLFKTFTLSNTVVFTLCFVGVTILFHHGLVWADFVLFGLIGSCVSSMFNLIMQFSFEVSKKKTYQKNVFLVDVSRAMHFCRGFYWNSSAIIGSSSHSNCSSDSSQRRFFPRFDIFGPQRP